MDIEKLLGYTRKPLPYEQGTAVMWTDPYISRRLLACHLDQGSDLASRRGEKIDLALRWILSKAGRQGMDILDLGCGPGLYAERLARAGHRVTGIDISSGSVDYARGVSEREGLGIEYRCGNYLDLADEGRFDLAIMIYLDFCVLKPGEREELLRRVRRSLKAGGLFAFDVVNGRNLDAKVLGRSWEASPGGGFWREGPYLALSDGYLFRELKVLVNQHVVIDAMGDIQRYLFWSSCYEPEDLEPLLRGCGFGEVSHSEGVIPGTDAWSGDNVAFYAARKG